MSADNGFAAYLDACRERVNRALDACLPPVGPPATTLKQAMRYSVQNGGKRVRASLIYASAEAIGCCSDSGCRNKTALDDAACAVELIHAYSLVHDDLPAMDDDDLRRGQPTCHIAFGEATAILAGDALQALAFECLARAGAQAPELVKTLASASGYAGMVGGQLIDLEGENHHLNLAELELMHRHKTGALIRASVRLGALVAGASGQQLAALDEYANALGLAFQVVDDILDVEGDTVILGKTSGADVALHKSTYPSLLGLEPARLKARDLHRQALDALGGFGLPADHLRQLADFVITRKN